MCTALNPDERLEKKMEKKYLRREGLMANCQSTKKQIEVNSTDGLELCPGCSRLIGNGMHECNCMIGPFSALSN